MEMPLLCLLWKEETHDIFLWQKTFSDCINRDFPDHPVVKTAGFLARGKGLIPGWGTMISHAALCGKNKKYQYMSLNSLYCQGSAFWLQLICAKAYREALGYQEHTLEWQRVWVVVGSLHFWQRFLYPQRILTHAYSRVVLRVLEAAVAAKKRFSVYITESQPDLSGQVSFPVVMCPAVPLMSKLRMRLHCKSSQTKSPIFCQSASPFTLPVPAPGRKITMNLE